MRCLEKSQRKKIESCLKLLKHLAPGVSYQPQEKLLTYIMMDRSSVIIMSTRNMQCSAPYYFGSVFIQYRAEFQWESLLAYTSS